MKINGVYLSYDIYDKEQMKAAKEGTESFLNACNSVGNVSESTLSEKENLIAEIYAFFGNVFGDDKAFEVLGENANLTECMCAYADFVTQTNDILKRASEITALNANRQTRRAAVHKRK